jgi:type IV pilus assembly protein PilM
MEILPRTMGTRPRLACEVRAEGVVAARAEDASALLSAVARVPLEDGIGIPHLRTGEAGVTVASEIGNSAANGIVGGIAGGAAARAKLVAAVKSALESVSLKAREVTLVVPDAAVRVLLLDFDELPTKPAEALPVVRFRLKKLLPFDADDAAVSYQIMATARGVVQVIAVAMPREVLTDYESVVREAGFEPGAILPSTLAALAGLSESDIPMLVVNAGREGVTTAIVKGGLLLLHRTVDLGANSPNESRPADLQQPPMNEAPAETSIAAIAARLAAAGTHAPVDGAQVPVIAAEIVFEASLEAPSSEVAQAVSVAAAYFEDTLQATPAVVLSAGTLGANALMNVLDEAYIAVGTVAVQEMVDPQMLGAGAASAGQPGGVPLGWLAGVRGALAN